MTPPSTALLAVLANPYVEGPPLAIEAEWAALQAVGAGRVHVQRLRPTTAEALTRTVALGQHTVLHFGGHGEPRRLQLEDEWGQPAWIDRSTLSAALRASGVKLLVLNACHGATGTAGLAQRLVNDGVVQAAVGFAGPIPDAVSAAGIAALYERLWAGDSLTRAARAFQSRAEQTLPGAGELLMVVGDPQLRLQPPTAAPNPPVPAFDLPRMQPFYGRRREAVALGRALAEPTVGLVVLEGHGGLGKTALARSVAARHAWRFDAGLELPYRPEETDADRLAAIEARIGPVADRRIFVLLDSAGDGPAPKLADRLPPGAKVVFSRRCGPAVPGATTIRLVAGLTAAATRAWCAARPTLPGPVEAVFAASLGHPGALEHFDAASGDAPSQAVHRAVLEGAADRWLRTNLDRLAATDEAMALLGCFPTHTIDAVEGHAALAALTGAWSNLPARWAACVQAWERAGLWVQHGDAPGMLAPMAAQARRVLDPPPPEASNRVLRALVRQAAGAVGRHAPAGEGIARRLDHWLAIFEAGWAAGIERRTIALATLQLQGWLGGRGEWDHAERWLTRTVDQLPEGLHQAEHSLRNAVLLHGRGELPAARTSAEDALARFRAIGDEPGVAAAQHQRATLAFSAGRFEEARAIAEACLVTLRRLGDRAGEATLLQLLANVEQTIGDLGAAQELLSRAIAATDEVGQPRKVAALRVELADIHHGRGRPDAARALLEEAIEVLVACGDQRNLAAAWHQLAILDAAVGAWDEARRHLERSAAILDALGAVREQAASLHQLGIVEFSGGNLNEAAAVLEEALAIKRALGGEQGLAPTLGQLGKVRYAQGHLEAALAHLREAMSVGERIGERAPVAQALHQLGVMAEARGDLNAARDFLRRSARLEEAGRDLRGRIATQHQLAIVETSAGAFDVAADILVRLLTDTRAAEDRVAEAAALHQLSVVKFHQGDLAEAWQHAHASNSLERELGNVRGLASSLHQMALIAYGQGDAERACALVGEAVVIEESIGDRAGCAASWVMLGQWKFEAGERPEGLRLVRMGARILCASGDARGARVAEILAAMEEMNLLDGRRSEAIAPFPLKACALEDRRKHDGPPIASDRSSRGH